MASGPVGVGGDAGHTSRVKTIMENRFAGCKVVARISCSITPEHPGGSLDVGTSRFRLLRQDDAVRDAELSRTEAQLRATARQQEAVAHVGQRALAGAPPDELIAGAAAIAARVLEVQFASVLELRPESRTLLLRAGVGWRDGAVGRTVLPADADSHAGYVLRSTGPVVVEDLATDARFGSAPLMATHGVVSSLSVLVHGKGRPFGILGVHAAQPREFTIHDTHFLQAVANVLATAIDRARAEEALRRSEEHFRSLIENGSGIGTVAGENGAERCARTRSGCGRSSPGRRSCCSRSIVTGCSQWSRGAGSTPSGCGPPCSSGIRRSRCSRISRRRWRMCAGPSPGRRSRPRSRCSGPCSKPGTRRCGRRVVPWQESSASGPTSPSGAGRRPRCATRRRATAPWCSTPPTPSTGLPSRDGSSP